MPTQESQQSQGCLKAVIVLMKGGGGSITPMKDDWAPPGVTPMK